MANVQKMYFWSNAPGVSGLTTLILWLDAFDFPMPNTNHPLLEVCEEKKPQRALKFLTRSQNPPPLSTISPTCNR